MITTLQGLFIVLFFVVPGFIVVEMSSLISPARKGSTFERTVQAVIYSTLIHLPATIFLAVVLCSMGTQVYILEFILANYPGKVLFAFLLYFIIVIIVAIRLGYLIPTRLKKYWLRKLLKEKMNSLQATSVWDYLKTEIRPTIGNSPYVTRAKFNMKTGIKYYGDIVAMPAIIDDDKPYDMFIQKVRRISRSGSEEKLNGINGILLNSANIETIEIKFVEPDINNIKQKTEGADQAKL